MDTLAAGVYRTVAAQLRPAEQLKLALKVHEINQLADDLDQDDRVLAVISNIDSGAEEASVFVFRVTNLVPLVLRLVHTIPITGQISISLAQVASTRSAGGISGTSDFAITIQGSDNDDRALQYSSHNTQAIRDLLEEIRRLKASSITGTGFTHPWLAHYAPAATRRVSAAHVATQPYYQQYLRPRYPRSELSAASAGQISDEERDMRKIRDDWIRDSLIARQDHYCVQENIRIRIGTFNVQSKPPTSSFAEWTHSPGDAKDTATDMYVFGFQELDTSPEALLYSTTTIKEDIWYDAIVRDLDPNGVKYDKLISKQLVGMLIIIMISKPLHDHIPTSSISSASVGVGILNTLGNKGGVALRIKIHDTVFCFVNSHLAAFDAQVDRRNSDFRELARRLVFFPVRDQATTIIPNAGVDMYDCDALFWMGDLNYRIDLPDQEVRTFISDSATDLSPLLEYDQLTVQRKLGNAFQDFEEPNITFPPTYKHTTGSTDSTSYDIRRRPAWTDRILYWGPDKTLIEPTSYTSCPSIGISDHKPVSAEYTVKAKIMDWDALAGEFDGIFEVLAASENDEDDVMPNVKLDPEELDFGVVNYMQKIRLDLQISNPGEVSASFRFIPSTNFRPISPPWLTIEPISGLLLPGDTKTIRIEVFIDKTTAAPFNSLQGKPSRTLSDVLILHVGRGKDHFIPVMGSFTRTCFASDLETLSRLPKPVREMDLDKNLRLLPPDQGISAPREIMRIIDWMMTSALAVDDLFLKRGNDRISQLVRERLDNGEELDRLEPSKDVAEAERVLEDRTTPLPVIALSVADTLLQFLESLTSPVVPFDLQEVCSKALGRDEALQVISQMPSINANVFVSLTAFLHFYVQAQPDKRRNASPIAMVFGALLLRDSPTLSRLTPLTKRNFILHFIDQ